MRLLHNSEDISSYQIRRLTQVFIEIKMQSQDLPRWKILRKAGLSDERMTIETTKFFNRALQYLRLY